MKKDYYSKVVKDLLKYREYKHRCKIIEQELNDKIEENRGVDYSQPGVQTSNIFKSTEETAIDRLDSDIADEYKEKLDKIARIEIAFQGLNPVEQFIIRKKYMSGRIQKDVNIYTHPKFDWGKNKYYEFKDDAVKKLARILGYNKNKQLVNSH